MHVASAVLATFISLEPQPCLGECPPSFNEGKPAKATRPVQQWERGGEQVVFMLGGGGGPTHESLHVLSGLLHPPESLKALINRVEFVF